MDDSITADFYFNKYSAHGNGIFMSCTTGQLLLALSNFRSKRVVKLINWNRWFEPLRWARSCLMIKSFIEALSRDLGSFRKQYCNFLHLLQLLTIQPGKHWKATPTIRSWMWCFTLQTSGPNSKAIVRIVQFFGFKINSPVPNGLLKFRTRSLNCWKMIYKM